MIIRSQDKKKLFNLEQIRKIDCETNSVMVDDISVIGTYSTEEKAIKVLDMVQKFYAVCELAKVGREVPSNVVTEFDSMIFRCFDMPQDSEV